MWILSNIRDYFFDNQNDQERFIFKEARCEKMFLQKARMRDGINYMQLRTVDQFHPEIYNVLDESFRRFHRMDRRYCPRNAESSHAVHHALLLDDFLGEQDLVKRQEILKKIADPDLAVRFFQELLSRGFATSWLEMEEIQEIVADYSLSKKVTCVECVLDVNMLSAELQAIQERFKKNENDYHIFIMNTGDLQYGLFGALKGLGAGREEKKIYRLVAHECVFYVLALEKKGDVYNCYIADLVEGADHIDDIKYSLRDRFFAETILKGASAVAYMDDFLQISRFVIAKKRLRITRELAVAAQVFEDAIMQMTRYITHCDVDLNEIFTTALCCNTVLCDIYDLMRNQAVGNVQKDAFLHELASKYGIVLSQQDFKCSFRCFALALLKKVPKTLGLDMKLIQAAYQKLEQKYGDPDFSERAAYMCKHSFTNKKLVVAHDMVNQKKFTLPAFLLTK